MNFDLQTVINALTFTNVIYLIIANFVFGVINGGVGSVLKRKNKKNKNGVRFDLDKLATVADKFATKEFLGLVVLQILAHGAGAFKAPVPELAVFQQVVIVAYGQKVVRDVFAKVRAIFNV